MASLIKFFALTFAISWPCFSAVAALARPGDSPADWEAPLRILLLMLGIFAPGIVAVWLTARQSGTPAVRMLLGRLFQWQAGIQWYLFAAGYVVAVKLIVALLHRGFTGLWPRFGEDIWLMPFAVLFSLMLLGQAGEELGWRGYALPRLAERYGLASSSLILGVIWALWHLPLFFVAGADTYNQSFLRYTLQVMALSVAITWLFAHTRGSLLLAMLMHAAINNTKDIVPSAGPPGTTPFGMNGTLVGTLTLVVLWIPAIYFLVRMPRQATEGASAGR